MDLGPGFGKPSSHRLSWVYETTGASIGVAQLRADGTLVLELRRPGGYVAVTLLVPTHVEYSRIAAHLGEMVPGVEKPVPPLPHPWDAAKVEAAAHAHASTKGWARADYSVQLKGTEEGRAVVDLSHAADRKMLCPGGGISVSLRVEVEAYSVVQELRFQ